MSEQQHRRNIAQLSQRKHFEEAFNASEYRLLPAEYVGWVYTAFHVGAYGVKRGGDTVDTGEAESRSPVSEPRAMRLLRAECEFLVAKRVPILRGGIDEIVGESAAA